MYSGGWSVAQFSRTHLATNAVQNPVQQATVLPGMGAQATWSAHEKKTCFAGIRGGGCEVVQSGPLKDRGLEPAAFL